MVVKKLPTPLSPMSFAICLRIRPAISVQKRPRAIPPKASMNQRLQNRLHMFGFAFASSTSFFSGITTFSSALGSFSGVLTCFVSAVVSAGFISTSVDIPKLLWGFHFWAILVNSDKWANGSSEYRRAS